MTLNSSLPLSRITTLMSCWTCISPPMTCEGCASQRLFALKCPSEVCASFASLFWFTLILIFFTESLRFLEAMADMGMPEDQNVATARKAIKFLKWFGVLYEEVTRQRLCKPTNSSTSRKDIVPVNGCRTGTHLSTILAFHYLDPISWLVVDWLALRLSAKPFYRRSIVM